MNRIVLLITAAALATAAPAMTAAAADLIYRGASPLTEGVVGKPYWAIQANCAGIYGAASAFRSEKGDAAGAAEARTIGVAFFHDAVDRVMKDRSVARPVAIEALSPAVIQGRTEALQMLAAEGDGATSKWNFARSACLDVRDAYAAQ